MTLANVGNEDLYVRFTFVSGPTDITPGQTTDENLENGISSTSSPSCEAPAGKAIQCTAISYTFTAAGGGCPFISGSHTFIAGGGAIAATATLTKCDGLAPMREGDTGTCAGTWTPPSTPPPTIPCACTTEVIDPQQTAVKAE